MTKSIHWKYGIFITIIFITSVATSLFLGKSLVWGLSFTLIVSLAILNKHQIPLSYSLKTIYTGIKSAQNVYLLVIMIGMNVSMWIASGIVPSLIYYGFDIIQGVNFLPFAYLISSIMAFFLGTGLGTISTMGIALFTLGIASDIPPAMLMGALISGAYVADRLSPISALVNFTLTTLKTDFKSAFIKTSKVMLPCALITFVFYWFIGKAYTQGLTSEDLLGYKNSLSYFFLISPYFFLLPLWVLWRSFKGTSSIRILGTGIFLGFMMAIFFQNMSIKEGIGYLLNGFKTSSDIELLKTLEIGGAIPMLEVVFIIAGGIALSIIFEICHFIQPLADFLIQKSNTPRKAVLYTGALSIFLNALTCDQTVGILLPGKYLQKSFTQTGQNNSDLYQTIANSGTCIAPLMPWNVNAIIILSITGVSAISFAPYALLNWLSFPLALLMINQKHHISIK